jgi:2-C-methyl-D-erythritol 4-phosphate cytidylyltransferase
MAAVALVLAAGQGIRLGAPVPKGLVRIRDRTILEWAAGALGRAPSVDAVLPVVPEGADDALEVMRGRWKGPARLLAGTLGGETRQDSVERGLHAALGALEAVEWVVVHDAARCLVKPDDVENVIEGARETGAAIPAIEVSDTIKEIDGGTVSRTLDRDHLVAVQTPQVFRAGLLGEALKRARRDGFQGTDSASLVERLGIPVRVVPGSPENWKLTVASDLVRAAALLDGPPEAR